MTSSDVRLAPLGRRTAAWLIDVGVGAVLTWFFVGSTGGTGDLRTLWHLMTVKSVTGRTGHELSAAMNPATAGLNALKPLAGLLAIVAVITVVAVAYRVVTTAIWGAGLGKSLLGLRIVVDGEPTARTGTGWGRAWRRWLVPQGPALIPLPATGLLAYLPALRDSRRRGLHDRAAGTVVIDARPNPGAAR